jgi:hypothetical protein
MLAQIVRRHLPVRRIRDSSNAYLPGVSNTYLAALDGAKLTFLPPHSFELVSELYKPDSFRGTWKYYEPGKTEPWTGTLDVRIVLNGEQPIRIYWDAWFDEACTPAFARRLRLALGESFRTSLNC